MLTKLPYHCAVKRHHNDNSTHMKGNYALFTLDATTNKIKVNLSLYSLYYAKACNDFTELISASLRPGNTDPF